MIKLMSKFVFAMIVIPAVAKVAGSAVRFGSAMTSEAKRSYKLRKALRDGSMVEIDGTNYKVVTPVEEA